MLAGDYLKQLYGRYGGFWEFPQMLDFCYLVNPFFCNSGILEEMEANFRVLVSEYPAGMKVNSMLAGKCWNINPEHIIPGNGAAELIKLLLEDIEGKVGIVRPTFEEYPNRLNSDSTVVFIPNDNNFRYSVDDLICFFGHNPIDVLVLINPDNPSGNFIPKPDLLRLMEWTRARGIRFVLDESFVDFSIGFKDNRCLNDKLLEDNPHLTVIKSISKSYGVPGLRLGIMCSADLSMIARMKKKVSIWNINSFAEYFMQIFPKYSEDYERSCIQFIEERDDFERKLKTIPYLRVMPSQANYFFVEVLPPFDSVELCDILLKYHNILCSACLVKKGIEPNRYMRVAVRNHQDNSRLIDALKFVATNV